MILETNPTFEPLDLVAELVDRYRLSALAPLLETTRAAVQQDEITVAILGRFKAGKSSFLNHFIGAEILPVGVVPVTAVVTEIRYGPKERAVIRFLDGARREIPVGQIGSYISEKENPENARQAALISVELPELQRFAGLKFVDTPGLESALAHNTQSSLAWLPNAGLALVAVSVDPPLSQRDIELLQSLQPYTPKIAVLLTKADLLGERDLAEVLEFVHAQLARHRAGKPAVFPYSIKAGWEHFRRELDAALFADTLGHFAADRQSILSRKMETLLREAGDYLTLSLKSAERVRSERQELKQQVVGAKEILADVKTQLRLVVQSAAARTRPLASSQLESHQSGLEQALQRDFAAEFPKWRRSLASMLAGFESWLAAGLRDQLTGLSVEQRNVLLDPLQQVRKQVFRILQQFRDRLSERTLQTFGVPLRTTESDIRVSEPSTPDVRVGRVFDRNWELLSPVLPVFLIEGLVRRHFERRISYLIYQNLSRLSTQWEASIHAALWAIEKEAARRLDELLATVELLLETGDERLPQIRADLERLQNAGKSSWRIVN